MSPVGTPDFNQNPNTSQVAPTFNAGESPNRLLMGGGSNSQSGRWLWATGFEDGLAEVEINNISYVGVESSWVYQGGYSCKIMTQAIVGDRNYFQKPLFPQGKRFGVECMAAFSFLGAVGLNDREFRVVVRGMNKESGRAGLGILVVRTYSLSPGYLSSLFIENNGVQTKISDINGYIIDSGSYFHYIKLVYDPYENQYIRVYFDDLIFDLGGVPGHILTTPAKNFVVNIELKTLAAAAHTAYVDNVIITADEP